jgi:flagellar hook assembly protein FlgD
VIRTLARRQRLEGDDTPHCFDWDGLSDAGDRVPPGKYRLRLSLVEADRVATSGERLRVPVGGTRS